MVKSVRLKTKGTAYKHYIIIDKDISHWSVGVKDNNSDSPVHVYSRWWEPGFLMLVWEGVDVKGKGCRMIHCLPDAYEFLCVHP